MFTCVEVDLNGFLVESLSQSQPCIDLVLTTSTHLDRLTYWADLSIDLDPTGSAFAAIVAAMFAAVGAVLSLRIVFDNLRTLTKEA